MIKNYYPVVELHGTSTGMFLFKERSELILTVNTKFFIQHNLVEIIRHFTKYLSWIKFRRVTYPKNEHIKIYIYIRVNRYFI